MGMSHLLRPHVLNNGNIHGENVLLLQYMSSELAESMKSANFISAMSYEFFFKTDTYTCLAA